MKTKIDKSYDAGFLLGESELRRFIDVISEAFSKSQMKAEYAFQLKLADGSILEPSNIDEILSQENFGSKEIMSLNLKCQNNENDSCVELEFKDGLKNPKNWDAISYQINSDNRDWAFVLASELDERVKKIKMISWARFFNSKILMYSVLLILMGFSTFTVLTGGNEVNALHTLEESYLAGDFKDPIEAMIFYEKQKREVVKKSAIMYVMLAFPFLLLLGRSLLPRIYPAYVFYWGDIVPTYDKRLAFAKTFWIVIVLGIGVSMAAGVLLRYV